MPIRVDCPRCKRPLAVPSKRAGSYVTCPGCKGRLWVPEESTALKVDAARAGAEAAMGSGASAASEGADDDGNPSIIVVHVDPQPPGPPPAPADGRAAARPPTAPQVAAGGGSAAPDGAAAPGKARFLGMDALSAEAAPGPAAKVGQLPSWDGAPLAAASPPAPPASVPLPPSPPALRMPPPPPAAPRPPSGPQPPLPPAPTSMAAMQPAPQPPAPPAPSAGPPTGRFPPPAPAPQRKVARFITAETMASTLPISADGKLPALQLTEGHTTAEAKVKSSKMNPLMLMGLLCLSVVMSITFVLLAPSEDNPEDVPARVDARREIEDNYFGQKGKPIEEYQRWLREAQTAYARGDYRTEHARYRAVQKRLNAEREKFQPGLTGSDTRDKRLGELLDTLQ